MELHFQVGYNSFVVGQAPHMPQHFFRPPPFFRPQAQRWADLVTCDQVRFHLAISWWVWIVVNHCTSYQWEIFRILKWRYVSTIFLAIFSGDIPWNLGLENRPRIYGRYLQSIGSCCMAIDLIFQYLPLQVQPCSQPCGASRPGDWTKNPSGIADVRCYPLVMS